jgi:hypothetical protein
MNPIPPSGRPPPLRRGVRSRHTPHPGRHLLHHTLLATLALQLSAPSWAGTQFQVNTYTSNYQFSPAIAHDSEGNFVVVWSSHGSFGSDIGSNSIQGQRYNVTGTSQGEQFQVNTYTTGNQDHPVVAMDSDGDFVVIWHSLRSNSNDNYHSIQGQRYNSAGISQESQFLVNSYTTLIQSQPAVAMDNDGDFVVIWQSFGSPSSDTDGWSIQGQRFNSAAIPQGAQFQVNSYTTGRQRSPAVAMDSDGDFIVTWSSFGSNDGDTDSSSIQGQRYNNTGIPQGNQFQINTYTTGYQREPDVSMDSDGNFVVVWTNFFDAGIGNNYSTIQRRRYSGSGVPQDAADVQVSNETTNEANQPDVAVDNDGDFVIVWHRAATIYEQRSYILGQQYMMDGTPNDSQFQVDTHGTQYMGVPDVLISDDGDFVVAWVSDGLPNSSLPPYGDYDWAIAARRFSLQPTDVSLVTPQPAAPTPLLPHFTLLALLSTLLALLTALYRRLRHSP